MSKMFFNVKRNFYMYGILVVINLMTISALNYRASHISSNVYANLSKFHTKTIVFTYIEE